MGRALSGNARARRAILIASVGGFFGFYLELSVFPVLAAATTEASPPAS